MKIKQKIERIGDALMKTIIFCDIYGSLSGVNEVLFCFFFSPWMCQECRKIVLPVYLGYNYLNTIFVDCWILKMEAEFFSETLVDCLRLLES